ncbi:hypothetical protein PDESU_02146 [Pontiella desulfatans]|uniref:Uroporphyrinogen decarboxylase (URO-D) domain-containing protein n=2 Tax=Pontiella desulfatans TaxID=2750659 RepID=A0A6C2U1A5_PONDE|nr:hypothetical protein PDESU_02146 [Pontiella desulfatans]
MTRKVEAIQKRIEAAYRFENHDYIPYVVSHMNYWMDGEKPERIPSDYFTNPKAMMDYQLENIRIHQEQIDDDYIPFLMPWFGTCVVPSALGCPVHFSADGDPGVNGSVISEPEQVASLKKPDYEKDGLMPDVLRTITYMRENSDLPIAYTDVQGPLNIALNICGLENLFCWFYTNPDEAHQLMDFATDVLIDWIKIQQKYAGKDRLRGNFPHGIFLPEKFGNIWLADDDCTQISAEFYREFVVPYNSRIFKEFGGGTLHFCGSAKHQLQNFVDTDGLVGVNNFCMGDFEQVQLMQELFKDRAALMICDFAPHNPEQYYNELFSVLKPEGTILASFVMARYALDNGKYTTEERDVLDTALRIDQILKEKSW